MYWSAGRLCLLLLTGCTTGNAELDEALHDTLLTAMGALEGSIDTAEAGDTTAGEDTTAVAEEDTADEDTTAPVVETEADTEAAVNDAVDATPISHKDNPYWGAMPICKPSSRRTAAWVVPCTSRW